MKDKNNNNIIVGDYVRADVSNKIGQIIKLEDTWCIDQWVATVESQFLVYRYDCNLLEKVTNEEAMLYVLEK